MGAPRPRPRERLQAGYATGVSECARAQQQQAALRSIRNMTSIYLARATLPPSPGLRRSGAGFIIPFVLSVLIYLKCARVRQAPCAPCAHALRTALDFTGAGMSRPRMPLATLLTLWRARRRRTTTRCGEQHDCACVVRPAAPFVASRPMCRQVRPSVWFHIVCSHKETSGTGKNRSTKTGACGR